MSSSRTSQLDPLTKVPLTEAGPPASPALAVKLPLIDKPPLVDVGPSLWPPLVDMPLIVNGWWALSPPMPYGSSCIIIALFRKLIPTRCGCLGTISMKSPSLIQKTLFRAANLGSVSASNRFTSFWSKSNGASAPRDTLLRTWRQSDRRWDFVSSLRSQAVSVKVTSANVVGEFKSTISKCRTSGD